MSGLVVTSQRCPGCGEKFPTSPGNFPIICLKCKTQPTKFVIKLYWQKKNFTISRDREGKTIHSWNHAVNLLGNVRSEIQAKAFDPEIYKQQSSTSFSIFWARFKEKYKRNLATHAKIHTIGEHHLSFFMFMQMRDIRAFHIDEWWEKLKGNGLSPHYMNDIQQWLKRFMNEAKELEIIEKVPRFPKAMKKVKKDIEWIRKDEQIKILCELPEHDRPIFEFMFLTGVRVGEAIALHRADVDMQRKRTIICHTIKRDRRTIGTTKNQSPRIIPHAIEIERSLKESLKITGLNKLVFMNKWGRIYTEDYLRDTFRKACKKAGVKRIHLKNATRHSFGMRLIENGIDIWTTKEAMGHSDIKMTENYVSLMADSLMDAYDTPRRNAAESKTTVTQVISFKGKK